MRSCRTASIVAFSALGAMAVIAACRDPQHPDAPPLTTAKPDGMPVLGASAAVVAAGSEGGAASAAAMNAPLEPPVKAKFLDVPAKLEADRCHRVLVAVVKGKVVAMNETLATGDVLIVAHGETFEATGAGTVVWAMVPIPNCVLSSGPVVAKSVVRASAPAKLEWAKATMTARLDVGAERSPELYLGRLEGTAAVAEHVHAKEWEILAAVEASGTFVLDGTEGRLGPRQIVMVPPGAKHAWKPEPNAKLVAVQMYSPPGPEQRFIGLAASEKDAGARDAR